MNRLFYPHAERPGSVHLGPPTVRLPLALFLALMWFSAAQAQYSYSIRSGAITITNYSGSGGDVAIPSTLDGFPVKAIGDGVFQNFKDLTRITIPNSVTTIGFAAFSGCSSLTSVTIPYSVARIGDAAFSRCTMLTGIAVDPRNLTYASLDGVLFSADVTVLMGYPGAKAGAYIIPQSVTSISAFAFDGCSRLTGLEINNSVTKFGAWAFRRCSGLTSVTIPGSIKVINPQAFEGCTGLTSVTIRNGVTSIATWAFKGCTGLTSLTIPKSVTSIGAWPFTGCHRLSQVYFSGNAPIDLAGAFQDTQATIFSLEGSTGWGATFGSRPTVPWRQRIVADDVQLGISADHFTFTLAGVPGALAVVEGCDELSKSNWFPVSNNILNTEGMAQFTDPSRADRPSRMYRLAEP